MIEIHESLVAGLLGQPETGMGYQIVEVRLGREAPEHVIALNASLAMETPDHGAMLLRTGVRLEEQRRFRRALETPDLSVSLRTLSRSEARRTARVAEATFPLGTGPASEAPIEQSTHGERFLRFSAFANDLRVLPDGSVLAGTYVTTYVDGVTHVRTGMDAVRRYALPNPDPAVHRYHLRPPQAIDVRWGTAQPAFGQPGGGAEVIFVDGAPAGTRYRQDQIPPGT